MTTTAASQQNLAELVSDSPARAAVLDRVGLDFCCHGNRSLFEACAEAGLDPDEVTAALETAADGVPASSSRSLSASLGRSMAISRPRMASAPISAVKLSSPNSSWKRI